MSESNTEVPEGIGLLDIAVIVSENWLLLLSAPLLAAVLALGIFALATPQTFDSLALLRLSPDEAAMLSSSRVLAPAIAGSTYLDEHGGSVSRALRDMNKDALVVTQRGQTEIYEVRLRDSSATEAQELLGRIINSLIANSAPTASEAALLAIRIEQAKRSIGELELNLARTNQLAENMQGGDAPTGATIGELGDTLVALLANIEERHARLFQLEEALRGSVLPEDVKQPPTLPDSPNASFAAMRSLTVGLAVAFAAFVFAFIAAGWKGASTSPEGLRKMGRIRRAFGLQPKF